MKSLRSLSTPTASVIRNGQICSVSSHDLVHGDIITFRTGDVLPADIRILSGVNIEIDEALLTGESLPVAKTSDVILKPTDKENPLAHTELGMGDRINLAYASTTVTKGRGIGIVYATGMRTELGKIAQAMANGDSKHYPGGKRPSFWKRTQLSLWKWLGLLDGTPLQIKLNKFAYILLFLAVICALIVFAVAEFHVSNQVCITYS